MRWPRGKRRAPGIPALTGFLVCCFFTCIVLKLKQEYCWRFVPPRETERKKTMQILKRGSSRESPFPCITSELVLETHKKVSLSPWCWYRQQWNESAPNIHNQSSVCPWKNPNLMFFVPWTIVTLHYTVGNDWPGFPLPLALITEDEYELTNGVYNLV